MLEAQMCGCLIRYLKKKKGNEQGYLSISEVWITACSFKSSALFC